ncbi:MAG TPA: DUF4430 domain-containing protein [Solirubrobacterales bacterium]
MSRRCGMAVAIALLMALATAGCGIGVGAEIGPVSLTVTRDYGSEPVAPAVRDGARESDTVMRVLDRNATIETRYGGGFVESIDGLSEAVRDGRRYDWFFYVNGVESPVGAADFTLHGGEAIWWDYRDWSAAPRVPAVVGAWPQPFASGYEGEEHPTWVECEGGGGACSTARDRLLSAGATIRDEGSAIPVLVGPWARLRHDPAAALLEGGPQESGVFAEFATSNRGWELVGLGEDGDSARRFDAATGLVAATRRYDGPPVWLVTGATAGAVRSAAALLDSADLRDHYAVATEGGEEVPLPLR